MYRTTITAAVVCLVVAGQGKAAAQAQAIAQAHPELVHALATPRAGPALVIQTRDGSEVTGSDATLSAGIISLLSRDGERITLKADDVARISLKDSNKNGVLIGAFGGAVGGLLLLEPYLNWCRNQAEGTCARGFPVVAGALVGTVAGAVIDNLRRPVLYRSDGRAVTVGPSVSSGPGAGGRRSLRGGVQVRW